MRQRPLPTSSLRIIYQNIAGWYPNFQAHRQHFAKYNADIIILTDTGVPNDNEIKFHPYECYQWNTEKKHSGVAILIKRNIQHSRIKQEKFQHDTIALSIETTTGSIIIAANYHPPRREYFIDEDLDWLANHQLPCYLFADLNAHHSSFPFHAKQDNERGIFLNAQYIERGKLSRLGPNFATYHAHSSVRGTTPDIILRNNNTFHNFHHHQLPPTCSDHLPTRITISSKPIMKRIKHENENKANWDGFSNEIKENTERVNIRDQKSISIDSELQDIVHNIKNAREKHIPKSTFVPRPFVPSSPKFRRLTKVLSRIHKAKTNTKDKKTMAHLSKQRREVILLLRREGKLLADNNWDNLMKETSKVRKSDSRTFWRNLKRYTGSARHKITLNIDNQRLTESNEVEEQMKRVWTNNFTPTPLNLIHPDTIEEVTNFFAENPTIDQPYDKIDFERLNPNCPYTKPISPSEVFNTIRDFKNKAPGEDQITRTHLMNLPKLVYVNIAHILTAALSCGYFPNCMKVAILIFIAKPGKSRLDPNNYRPISLLSVIGKIYGKIITQRFTTYLETTQEYENQHQYGFRKNRSTMSCIAMNYEYIARHTANTWKSRVSVVGRDIKGAFNHLWHPRVKWHILNIKMPPLLAKALCHFLDGRTAKIRIGNHIGNPFDILAGTPQGASPSAKLFNLVIRKSPLPEEKYKFHQYDSNFADDCTQIIATPGKSANLHAIQVEKAIKRQNEFEFREGLITEPSKTWILPISQAYSKPVKIGNVSYKIQRQNVKMLGLKIHHRTFVRMHVKYQCNKANAELANIRRCCKGLDKPAKMNIIRAKIIPLLLYPPIPLHLASVLHMGKLQAIQNKALNFVYGLDRTTDRTTAKQLHMRKPQIDPINVVLHRRAKRIWEEIEEGKSADKTQFDLIKEMTITPNTTSKLFPSSYLAAIHKDEPRPMYTSFRYNN